MNRPDFSVADLGELDTLLTTEIVEGANVWVDADGAYWTLEKDSGAAPGPTVRQPLAGAPQAGAANARWLRQSTGGGGGAILQIVTPPNLAVDYQNGTPVETDILSASITLTTGTRVLAVANAYGKVKSCSLRIFNSTLGIVLAAGGPTFAIEPVAGTSEAFALQGHETGLTPGATYVFKLQGACDVPLSQLDILAGTDPTKGHASLTLYELP